METADLIGGELSDPERVLHDVGARAVVVDVVNALRRRGLDFGVPGVLEHPDTAVAANIARRVPVAEVDAVGVLGSMARDALAAGVAQHWEEDGITQFRLGFGALLVRRTAAILPAVAREADRVYLSTDTVWFLEVLWPRLVRGKRALDLGTGTGFLAASLTRRFADVTCTDLYPHAVATAALTRLVNPALADRLHVVRADVGAGLRPASFDLVTANPPWVPSSASVDHQDESVVVYADGGPTGFELPARFLNDAAALLAPGGLAAVMCIDGEMKGGLQPIQEEVAQLRADGFHVKVHLTAAQEHVPDLETVSRARLPELVSARHVCVLVRRPG